MKKLISTIIVITVFCFILVACGQNDAFRGTWTGTTADGTTLTIVFSSNNNASLTMGAHGLNGTYSVDGDVATITPDHGGDEATATLAGENTLIFIAGGESVELSRN